MNQEQCERITQALLVMVLDFKIRAWLEINDPKALEQAYKALENAGMEFQKISIGAYRP